MRKKSTDVRTLALEVEGKAAELAELESRIEADPPEDRKKDPRILAARNLRVALKGLRRRIAELTPPHPHPLAEKFRGMADAALEAEAKRLDGALRETRGQLHAVRLEIELRAEMARARTQVAKLSPSERAALAQALGVEGIESSEAVGNADAAAEKPRS